MSEKWALQISNMRVISRPWQKSSQYFGEDGEAGEVGEYFGDDGDIWAGAITKCQQGEHSKVHKLTSCIRRQETIDS